MKSKEKQTLISGNEEEMAKQIADLEQKLVTLSVNGYTKQSKNTRERKMLRYKIAYIKTAKRMKELSHGI